MSVIVLKRKFETVPAATDIMQLLFGQDTGDRDKAKDALQAFLTPVKDLLDLLYLVDQMKASAERHVQLLVEQDALMGEIATAKGQLAGAKVAYDKAVATQNAKLADLSDKIATLEKAAASLEDEQATRDRLNKAVVAEVEATKAKLLAEVAKEETAARTELDKTLVDLTAAKAELTQIKDALSKLTSGGGGDVLKHLIG